MHEQRKHARVSLHTEIWLGQDGIFSRTGRAVRNVSEGGALIETTEDFSVGSVVSLRFTLPGGRNPISCAATVRNMRNAGAGLGVEFLDLSEDDRDLIRAFVSQGNPGSSDA